MLTIFWHCDFRRFSSRTAAGSAISATKRQRFWPKILAPKGLAMLIRGEIVGVWGGMADAVRIPAIALASLPTLLLGGCLALIGP
jgi:hypothetical protein